MAPSQEPALPPSGAAKEAEMSEMGVDKMGDTPGPHSGIKVSRRLSSQFWLEDDVHCVVESKFFFESLFEKLCTCQKLSRQKLELSKNCYSQVKVP